MSERDATLGYKKNSVWQRAVRGESLDDGRSVFLGQALLVGHFGYFIPNKSTYCMHQALWLTGGQ